MILGHIMRQLVEDPDEDPVPAPCQVFDLICGTSTGGLIAIILGRLGLDCDTAIRAYRDLGPAIFGQDDGAIMGNIMNGERFSSETLEKALGGVIKKYAGSENALMKELKASPDTVKHPSTDVSLSTTWNPDSYLCLLS